MPRGIQTIFSARLAVLAWTIIWVLTVPLFHTHLPDISDRLTLQGGVAHTVFSPDLPGEFFQFSADYKGPFAHLSNRTANSPELGFVLSSGDPKDRNIDQPSVLGVLCYVPDRPFLPRSSFESRVVHNRPLIYAAVRGPRAPPTVS